MFSIILEDQQLPGYANPMTIQIDVPSILLTTGSLQAQWSISLPKGGPTLPGATPPPPLFANSFDMPAPPAIVAGLEAYFKASAPALVAGLLAKAQAAEAAALAAAQPVADSEVDPNSPNPTPS